MFKTLLGWELKMISRETGFWVGLLVLFGLLLLAAFHQRESFTRLRAQVEETLVEKRNATNRSTDLLAGVERGERQYASMWDDPRGYFMWHKTIIPYPFDDMAFWSTGQRDLFAPTNEVGIYARPQVAGNDIANPIPQLFGSFDPAFVLIYLLPLLAIAISYNCVSGERERGSLKTLFAQPLSPVLFFTAKILLRFLGLMGPVTLMIGVCLLVGGISPLSRPLDFALLVLLTASYAAFWFLAALVVNLYGKSSATNALILASLWAAFALLLPATINTTAEQLFPVPSRVRLVSEMRGAENEARSQRDTLMAQYYNDHPELTENRDQDTYEREKGFFIYYQRMFAVDEAVDRRVAHILERFERQLADQQQFERLFSFLSPVVLMEGSMDILAGVSAHQYQNYANQIKGFGDRWRDFFMAKAYQAEMITTGDLERFPVFSFQPQRFTSHHLSHMLAILALDLLLLLAILYLLRGGILKIMI